MKKCDRPRTDWVVVAVCTFVSLALGELITVLDMVFGSNIYRWLDAALTQHFGKTLADCWIDPMSFVFLMTAGYTVIGFCAGLLIPRWLRVRRQ